MIWLFYSRKRYVSNRMYLCAGIWCCCCVSIYYINGKPFSFSHILTTPKMNFLLFSSFLFSWLFSSVVLCSPTAKLFLCVYVLPHSTCCYASKTFQLRKTSLWNATYTCCQAWSCDKQQCNKLASCCFCIWSVKKLFFLMLRFLLVKCQKFANISMLKGGLLRHLECAALGVKWHFLNCTIYHNSFAIF